jgi:membrane-bound ClpP family serine protease
MSNKLTATRLVLAVISTGFEETAIWAVWRWVLPDFGVELPLQLLIAVMVAWAGFSIWLFIFTTRTLRKQAQVGLPSMVGTKGRVASPLNPEGLVKIRGELWGAITDEGNIEAGTEVMVVRENGLKLSVRRISGAVAKR